MKAKPIAPLFILALCLSASAAPPVPALPTVTRKAPLLSPKAASAPKTTPMFIPASVNPPVPMTWYFQEVNDAFGKYRLTAELIQPAGQATLFEYNSVLGGWQPLAWFGGDPNFSQQVSAFVHFDSCTGFIRATLAPMPPFFAATAAVKSSSGITIKLNPAAKGAGASARRK